MHIMQYNNFGAQEIKRDTQLKLSLGGKTQPSISCNITRSVLERQDTTKGSHQKRKWVKFRT